MEKSSFFDSVLLPTGVYDREYLAEDFASYFSRFIGNGVFPNPSTGLQLKQNEVPNMEVILQPGFAFINGYKYENDANKTFEVSVADGVNPRKDIIVIQWSRMDRSIVSKYIKGSPGASPQPPTITRSEDYYDLQTCVINVPAAATKITQDLIEDTRLDKKVCGIVTGVVDQVDTTTLYQQIQKDLENFQNISQAEFDQWFADVQGQLSGDVAGKLTIDVAGIKDGSIKVGNSDKLDGLDSTAFTKAYANVTSGSIFDWADSQNQSVMFLCGGPGVTGLPISSTYYNGILMHISSTTKCMILFRRASSGITTQAAIAIKNNNAWSEFFDINAKYANNLISPNGNKTVSLADNGSINLGGTVYADGFSQNSDAFGQPVEIGQFLDMHKAGSTSDHDARIYINPSNNRVFLANPNDTNTQGYFVTNPDNNIFQIKKLTQSQYDSLQTKVPSTIYLITG